MTNVVCLTSDVGYPSVGVCCMQMEKRSVKYSVLKVKLAKLYGFLQSVLNVSYIFK